MPTSNLKSTPLTSPATPIALQPQHLLSPPADLLTNTATTLKITPTQDTKSTSPTFTVHRIRAHEDPDSPDRNALLYTVHGKPWPNTSRVICDADGVPVLVLRRVWLSRKWTVKLPEQHHDLLVASVPSADDGPGSRLGVGGGGFRLEVRFANALADEPPPYSAVSGVGVGVGETSGSGRCEGNAGMIQMNEKVHPPPPSSHSQTPIASTPRHTEHPQSPSILPSYDSVRRDSPNSLRDLLDALEPRQEPAPATPFPASASQNVHASTSTSTNLGLADAEADATPSSKVELRVMQVTTLGTGVMMGSQKIMDITRHNAMDYSKSKVRLRPRWEVEVSEGVDLLLAVNIALIMAESVSTLSRWK
ncbi:hypothetical protein N7453_005021 [Penicillium expansum]|nr:hypothetical protein N7453_005021 [Penicillium expansum]